MAKVQTRRSISFSGKLHQALEDEARKLGEPLGRIAERYLRLMLEMPIDTDKVAPT
jgi:hypothetical protein